MLETTARPWLLPASLLNSRRDAFRTVESLPENGWSTVEGTFSLLTLLWESDTYSATRVDSRFDEPNWLTSAQRWRPYLPDADRYYAQYPQERRSWAHESGVEWSEYVERDEEGATSLSSAYCVAVKPELSVAKRVLPIVGLTHQSTPCLRIFSSNAERLVNAHGDEEIERAISDARAALQEAIGATKFAGAKGTEGQRDDVLDACGYCATPWLLREPGVGVLLDFLDLRTAGTPARELVAHGVPIYFRTLQVHKPATEQRSATPVRYAPYARPPNAGPSLLLRLNPGTMSPTTMTTARAAAALK